MILKYRYIYIILVFCLFSLNVIHGQTVKQIEVEEGKPFVDHIALVEGGKDMDLLVKFTFNEPHNSLTVSLISYKKLFVFQDNVRYKKSKRFRKLIPEKLPYVVATEPTAVYKYTKSLRKSIKPKRKHVFKRWIMTEGLQPQPIEYKMVNDFIEQGYDILAKNNKVVVQLRDVLVMEQKPSSKKKYYELFFQTNLNLDYEITIKRNPCFGLDELLLVNQQHRENVEKSFLSLKAKFGPDSGPVSKVKVPLFHEMKAMLLDQFPKVNETSECLKIQEEIDKYNAYVDSISQIKYSYEEEMKKPLSLDLEADYILQMARKIDNLVNRWQIVTDETEREDLSMDCFEIISSISDHINKAATMNNRQAAAVQVFLKAKAYYENNCTGK